MKLRSILGLALALAVTPALAQVNPGTSPLSGAKGGTANAFMQFAGPATSLKTYTLANASGTLAQLNQVQTWTGAQSFTDGTLILLGSGSGSSTLKAPATGGGTATLFAGSDTIAGLVTAQTLTNKTISGASNTLTARIASDVSGLGTGIATALAVNVGTAGSPVVNGGAGGTPSSLTLTSATGLPLSTGVTGTLQAAQEPAHTGDMTNSAGSLATTVVAVNGVNQTTAWTTYTPTIACQAGTITTLGAVSGASKILGKTVFFSVVVPITTVGTCTGFVTFTFPGGVTANRTQGASGKDSNTGKMINAGWASASTTGAILLYDGTTAASSGANLIITGELEQQ